jgi:hypothetical protein
MISSGHQLITEYITEVILVLILVPLVYIPLFFCLGELRGSDYM